MTGSASQGTGSSGRIAIIGVGSVGATVAYAVMLRGFATEIILIDANADKAEAEAKDLNHGLRFVPSVRIRTGTVADCVGAEIVIVTAGAKQKPDQTRLDLTQTNTAIFRELVPAIGAAAPDAILLVVSNPVDVLTCVASRLHVGGPQRVLGSGTVLDSSRFVTLIADRIGVSVHNVHAYIVGEHGESELPLWSSAHIGNIPLSEFRSPQHPVLTVRDRSEIVAKVRSAAAEIIAVKGATNWAVGLATARIVEAIRRDENAVLTVSRRFENDWDIPQVCLSMPCIVNRNGAERPLPIPLDEVEFSGLRHSAEVLLQACESAGTWCGLALCE